MSESAAEFPPEGAGEQDAMAAEWEAALAHYGDNAQITYSSEVMARATKYSSAAAAAPKRSLDEIFGSK